MTMNTLNTSALEKSKSSLFDKLLDIYWAKKELDGYLPNIAKYAKPEEVSVIALTQLRAVEKQVLKLMQELQNFAVPQA